MRISLLMQQTRFWPEFHEYETLLGTLSRVLRDDHRRNTDVAIHIIAIFFALSSASQFHPALLENQVGNTVMQVIELEIQRSAYTSAQVTDESMLIFRFLFFPSAPLPRSSLR